MKYIKLEDILTRFPHIKRRLDQGNITEDFLNTLIDDTNSLIDSYITEAYEPDKFSEVPRVLKTVGYELFLYFYQEAIHTPTPTGDEIPWLEKRYERVISILEDIKNGRINLIIDNTVIEPSVKVRAIKSNHLGISPIFDIEKEPYEQKIPEGYGKKEVEYE